MYCFKYIDVEQNIFEQRGCDTQKVYIIDASISPRSQSPVYATQLSQAHVKVKELNTDRH